MEKNRSHPIAMKIFPKGQVVIPVALREQYDIEIGDYIDVQPTDEGILLKSRRDKRSRQSLTAKLHGIFSEQAKRSKSLSKRSIDKVTESGFTEGWDE